MEKYREQLVGTIIKALSFDCVQAAATEGAPFGRGNRDCLDYVLSLCEEFGFKTKNLDGYCGIADIGEGDAFGILGHLDVVPFGKGWTKNPLGEIVDDVIYGRGILDDKGPMLACVYAVKALLDEGMKPKRKIRFIFGCNEESGWECIAHYNRCEVMPETGFSPDADFPVINCEKGIVNYTLTKKCKKSFLLHAGERPNVVPNECGAVMPFSAEIQASAEKAGIKTSVDDGELRLFALGKSAHAATPWEGDNAIVGMTSVLGEFDNDLKRIAKAFATYDGKGCGLNLRDEQSGALTVNLGIISCDRTELSFTLDIRYPVTIPEAQILDVLEKTFPDYNITKPHFHPPLFVDKDDELVQTLLKTYNKVTGENASAITIGGGTYARALKKGVAFGPEFPGVPSTIHQPDEHVDIPTLMRFSEIYYEAIKALLFE